MSREEQDARAEEGETSGESESTCEESGYSTAQKAKRREERVAGIGIWGAAAVILLAFIGAVTAIVLMK